MPKDEAQKTLDALKPLLEKLRQQQAAVYETLEEIQQRLGGESLGVILKTLEQDWQTQWGARYGGSPYAFEYVKDRPQWKRLLRMLSQGEIGMRIALFIRDTDPFLVQARHPFGLFVRNINRYAPAEKPAWTCPSDPPCPPGTSQWQCERRAIVNEHRAQDGRPLL